MLRLDRKRIITHRGLEPDKPNFFPESSLEAFSDHLSRGFGIEFDPNWTRDNIVVWHDELLKRASGESDTRKLKNITSF